MLLADEVGELLRPIAAGDDGVFGRWRGAENPAPRRSISWPCSSPLVCVQVMQSQLCYPRRGLFDNDGESRTNLARPDFRLIGLYRSITS